MSERPPYVWLVQDTKWIDPRDGQLKSKFDFTAAERFGELHELLEPTSSPFNLEPVLKRLHDNLEMFCDDDYLLLVGSPVLLGIACAVASYYNDGNVSMLQWSGAKRDYIPVLAKGITVGL